MVARVDVGWDGPGTSGTEMGNAKIRAGVSTPHPGAPGALAPTTRRSIQRMSTDTLDQRVLSEYRPFGYRPSTRGSVSR